MSAEKGRMNIKGERNTVLVRGLKTVVEDQDKGWGHRTEAK